MSRLSHIVCVFVFVYVFVFVFVSCKEHRFTSDPSALLTFSCDTVDFDTVFTAAGSSTRRIMIYNNNANALRISRAWWKRGTKFFASIDGENNPQLWNDMQIYGGDSLFLFIRVEIDPYNADQLPLECDTLFFEVNGRQQHIACQAVGMNVQRIRSDSVQLGYHFTNLLPYLIYDTMRILGPITIDPGTTLYMHAGATILAFGSVQAEGTITQPIRVLGDRTDYLFPNVPYSVASGQWGGIYLLHFDSLSLPDTRYQMANIQLLSGQVGLFCYSDNKDNRAALALHNARIHNMSAYGLVLENTDARLSNVEVSNCAAYGIYLCGGNHRVEHTSVANFFGYPYTTLNIHNTTRQKVAAVYVQASSANMAPSSSSFYNSIITGAVSPALVIDSIPATGYTGQIAGCYLRCDSDSLVNQPWAHHNRFAKEQDTVFVNTYYRYGEYIYYDYRLPSSSAARQIGLPLDSLILDVQRDMLNNQRDPNMPDAGCYTYF